MEFKK